MPKVEAWKEKDLQKSEFGKTKRRRIFDRDVNKKYPITEEVFGKNLGALVKQQFMKEVDIMKTIDTEVKKKMFNFHFPTFEQKLRKGDPIEVIPQTYRLSTLTLRTLT